MLDGRDFLDFEEVMLEVERRAPERRPQSMRRRSLSGGARVALATAALTALVIPIAASAAGDGADPAGASPVFSAPIRVNADSDTYAIRGRNTGAGGAARLSCKRGGGDPCLVVNNRDGGPAARFVGDEGAPPFEVDSKVRVDGLNADRLDGRTASQIVEDAVELGAGGRAPSGPAGGDLTGTYPDPQIATDAVGTDQIAAGSVTDADVAPANVDGTAATPSLRTLGTGAQQAAAGNDPRFTDSRAPSGAAGGDLTGTYPNPTLGNGSIDSTSLFASSLQDGAAGTATLRSLGTGAQQAVAGDDSRLSDSRTPTGSAGGDLTGTYPNPTLADDSVDSTTVADHSLRLGDTAVLSSAVSVPPFSLPANSCAGFSGSSSDVQAGDVIELDPPVDGTDNELGVVWTSGTQDGDGIFKVLACNNTSTALSAGGTIPIYAFRP